MSYLCVKNAQLLCSVFSKKLCKRRPEFETTFLNWGISIWACNSQSNSVLIFLYVALIFCFVSLFVYCFVNFIFFLGRVVHFDGSEVYTWLLPLLLQFDRRGRSVVQLSASLSQCPSLLSFPSPPSLPPSPSSLLLLGLLAP